MKLDSNSNRSEQVNGGLAIVTGGRCGIGRAICIELASIGFDIAIVEIEEDQDGYEIVCAAKSAGRRANFYQRDISQTAGNDDLIARIEEDLGQVACLVNNAGVQVKIRGDLLHVSDECFDRVLGINLRGTFSLTQVVARAMLSRSQPAFERSIVTITSAIAGLVSPEKGPYGLSKAGLSMASQQFAVRLANAAIRVHETRPGLIDTEMTADDHEAYPSRVEAGNVSIIRRWGRPEDIARCVATLAASSMHLVLAIFITLAAVCGYTDCRV